MGKKILIKNVQTDTNSHILTSKRVPKFNMLLSDEIQKKYNFDDMQRAEANKFVHFLKNTIGKDWSFVDKAYLRKPDKSDEIDGHNIIHYGFADSFRIHGYINNGVFVVIRIDPNHRFHD